MKKILILSLLIFSLAGCKKNFDPQLYGTLSPSTFPSNHQEFELYTLDLYLPFYAKWGYGGAFAWENNFFSPEWGHIVMFDGSTDLMNVWIPWHGFWEGFTSADFTFMKTQGRGSHFEKVRQVTKATKIIDDIQNSSVLTTAQKTLLLAEARMARGWIMYYLLHMYGPVPVILDPAKIATEAEADVTKPSRSDFVLAVAGDLRFASDNLPVTPKNYGRFNKGNALAVLMRLYLNEKDFAKAEAVGREILPLGYKLVNDYSSLFKEATEKNTETIWAAVSQNAPANGSFNPWPFYSYPSDYVGKKIPTGWGNESQGVLAAAWSFYDSFDPADKRRQLIIPQYTSNTGVLKNRSNLAGAVFAKYPDDGGAVNSVQGNDLVVTRYADVLLMLAEAINENSGPTPEAVGYVNQIRQRAGVADVSAAEKASKDAFRNMLFIERAHELFFEGHRKMDLVRMNKVQSALAGAGKTPGPNYSLFPLPDYAINNSNGQLKQNAGY